MFLSIGSCLARSRIALAAVAAAVTLVPLAGVTHAMYSCGDPMRDHCYGTASWERTGVAGVATTVSNLPLRGGPNGFVDDEVWFIDQRSPACTGTDPSNPGMCWVEAGTVSIGTDGPTTYFWADRRPGEGFALHLVAPVPLTHYGYDTSYTMVRGSALRAAPTPWAVPSGRRFSDTAYYLYIWAGGARGTGFIVATDDNTMTGTRMDIGQELAGASTPTDAASAPPFAFSGNSWYDATGVGHYQTTDGLLTSADPPHATWDTRPSSSATGGKLVTSCC